MPPQPRSLLPANAFAAAQAAAPVEAGEVMLTMRVDCSNFCGAGLLAVTLFAGQWRGPAPEQAILCRTAADWMMAWSDSGPV
jgi:hypothetical protein